MVDLDTFTFCCKVLEDGQYNLYFAPRKKGIKKVYVSVWE
jgi:hypothetical protein